MKKTAKISKKHALETLTQLEASYPDAHCALRHKNPWQLLVATILSAQCTDVRVNMVTPALFARYPDPQEMAKANLADVEEMIRSTGFFRNKAKNLIACAAAVCQRHAGSVPQKMDALVALPGVGRKTANVILGNAFAVPGMVVDTHVGRITKRLELTKNNDPVKIEFDLMKKIPQKEWSNFSLRLIYFGRAICRARKPLCPDCPLQGLCPYTDKTV